MSAAALATSVPVQLGRTRSASGGLTDTIEAGLTPIDVLLGRQQELTPVERFARVHEADLIPAGERWWADRLPTAAPGVGEQYAFEVDLDSCTGCKACVSACNNLNGLDEGEQWRAVTTVHGTTATCTAPAGPSVLTVTAACHHCVEPACLAGCPVDAYEKDPITGIVAHLDDQCIGCSYCTLTCPYEVPLYNADLGIVRKCDMCRGRLAEGEAPACVQGCPNGAITITVVDVEVLRAELVAEPATRLVPGAPDSTLTVPTTRYRSRRVAAGAVGAGDFADHRVLAPSHEHTPLSVMLTLTQVSVGASTVGAGLGVVSPDAVPDAVAVTALGVALVALAASVGHLGRPLQAWRAVIGIRHSWLSREIVALGAFAGLGVAHALSALVGMAGWVTTALEIAAAGAGLAGLACSVMLYAVTGRTWWRVRTSTNRFGLTALAGGSLLVAAVALGWPSHTSSLSAARVLLSVSVAVTVVSLIGQALVLRPGTATRPRSSDLGATRSLLSGPLKPLLGLRVGATVLGGVVIPLVARAALAGVPVDETSLARPGLALACLFSLVVFMLGEYTDRRLFFSASVAPRHFAGPQHREPHLEPALSELEGARA